MSTDHNLPVILVSAVDTDAASVLIKDIINDGSQSQCNGVSHDGDNEPHPFIWHMSNKYYSASVRLCPLADNARPDPGDDVQAHIIYLTEDECSDDTVCGLRSTAARVSRHAVRLVAAHTAHEPPALAAWACAAHYELVPLLAPHVDDGPIELLAPPVGDGPIELLAPPVDDGPIQETKGAARLREALQAHAWPGMRRAGAVRAPPLELDDDSSSSSWGSWTAADEELAVERASQFADVLSLLPAERATDDDDAARRLRAEQLVVAFCRALGHDLDLDGNGEGDL